jgi:hypothetical protein
MVVRKCIGVLTSCVMAGIIGGRASFFLSKVVYPVALHKNGQCSLSLSARIKRVPLVSSKCDSGILRISIECTLLRDVDNGFVLCCILHNMLLEEDGYLDVNLEQNLIGMMATLRKMFANVALMVYGLAKGMILPMN